MRIERSWQDVANKVVYSPEALQDLRRIYTHIADLSGPARARAYTGRIEKHCLGLAIFPERGAPRYDIRHGLRITALHRRVAIAFHLSDGTVIIDRILYGGRDLASADINRPYGRRR